MGLFTSLRGAEVTCAYPAAAAATERARGKEREEGDPGGGCARGSIFSSIFARGREKCSAREREGEFCRLLEGYVGREGALIVFWFSKGVGVMVVSGDGMKGKG